MSAIEQNDDAIIKAARASGSRQKRTGQDRDKGVDESKYKTKEKPFARRGEMKTRNKPGTCSMYAYPLDECKLRVSGRLYYR